MRLTARNPLNQEASAPVVRKWCVARLGSSIPL
jgi:hypothetical protein